MAVIPGTTTGAVLGLISGFFGRRLDKLIQRVMNVLMAFSMLALAFLRLVPNPPGKITGGPVLCEGKNLAEPSEREMRTVCGRQIAMIFQGKMSSLNPVLTVGRRTKDPVPVIGADGTFVPVLGKASLLRGTALTSTPTPRPVAPTTRSTPSAASPVTGKFFGPAANRAGLRTADRTTRPPCRVPITSPARHRETAGKCQRPAARLSGGLLASGPLRPRCV